MLCGTVAASSLAMMICIDLHPRYAWQTCAFVRGLTCGSRPCQTLLLAVLFLLDLSTFVQVVPLSLLL